MEGKASAAMKVTLLLPLLTLWFNRGFFKEEEVCVCVLVVVSASTVYSPS